MLKVRGFNLARAVKPREQFVDALAIDIETDHRNAGTRKRNRDRQTDIAEADDGDFSSVCQWISLARACLTVRHTGMQWGRSAEKAAIKSNRFLPNARS